MSEYKETPPSSGQADTSTETLVRYIRDNSGKAISMINYQDRSSNNEVRSFTYDNKNQLVKVKKEYPDTDLIPDSWQPVNLEPGDGRSAEFAKEGKYSLKIVGSSTKTKSVKQNVATSGSAGDALTFSGWNKTINSSTAGKCVVALFYFNNKDGSRKYAGYLFFGRETHDWRQRSATFIAEKDYSSIDITIGYFYQAGVAYFDDFKLSKANSTEELLRQPSFKLDSDIAEYVYDGKGNRYSKTVNGQTRYYSHDTSGNIVSEYKRVILNGSEESQTLVRYVRDTSGKAISMINYEDRSSNNEARTFYFIYNGHGDVIALTDSPPPSSGQAGTVVATYSYDEFGNQTSSTGTVYNPLRYSGAHNAYYDSETSLYKMGTRYYQPDIGRWLTRDEKTYDVDNLQTHNMYTYSLNNPITRIDPSGYKSYRVYAVADVAWRRLAGRNWYRRLKARIEKADDVFEKLGINFIVKRYGLWRSTKHSNIDDGWTEMVSRTRWNFKKWFRLDFMLGISAIQSNDNAGALGVAWANYGKYDTALVYNQRSFNMDSMVFRHEMGHLNPWHFDDNAYSFSSIMNYRDFSRGYYGFGGPLEKKLRGYK